MLKLIRRKAVRAFWLVRYWLLWKYRRPAAALALAAVVVQATLTVRAVLEEPAAGTPSLAFSWVAYLVILVVSAIVSYALAPKPPDAQGREATRPVVEDGMGVPLVFGDVWIDAPATLAWKQLGADPIRRGGKK